MNDFLFSRGSEWRKWDLHAHTPLDPEWIARPSLKTEADKRLFAKQYVEAAVMAELAVIAITDHNFCSHYDELIIPYLQEAAASLDLTILPGFEVTVSDCGGTHVLVIFSEKSSLVTIDEVVTQLFPAGAGRFQGNNVSASEHGIEKLNKILGQSDLNYLIIFAHADRENGVLHHRGGTHKVRLWQQPFVRIAQLSKPPSQYTGNGFIANVVNCIDSNYERDITYIMASDCRSLDPAIVSPERWALGSRWTWIKADPTFEGLRQIIFEPNDRTRFQEHKPEEKPSFLTIDQVRFLGPSGIFQSEPIPLNPNLTTIIGGKSTGKSILLSCISQAIDGEQARERTKIAKTNIYDLSNLDFEVTWTNGDIDRLSESKVRHRVTFLPQMYIHRLVEKENRASLSAYLLQFLRQNEPFEECYRQLSNERYAVVTELATETSNFFALLSSWQDVTAKIKGLGDKKSVESELKTIAEKSDKLRKASGFSKEETEQYNKMQQDLADKTKQIEIAQRIESCMREIAAEIPTVTEDAIARLDGIVGNAIYSHGLGETETQIIVPHVKDLKRAIQDAHTIFLDDVSKTARELSRKTILAEKAAQNAKSALKPFWDKIANQEELRELQELSNQLTSILKEIQVIEKERSQIERKYWASVDAMEELVAVRFAIQEQLIELFNNPQYTRIGDDIIISAEMTFDKDKFETDFLGCFDLRHSMSQFGPHFRDNNIMWNRETHIVMINSTLRKLIDTKTDLNLRAGQTMRNAVEMLLRDYLSHTFSVQQAGEDIFRMSPGKQGLILLEIFLHFSDSRYPILIDQPEENLDNRTIYSHLVNYIKKKKLHRQIIMVTHNPNLVLGTDSEQVVVANQDGEGFGENKKYRFEYYSGSIECSFTNPEAASVLESHGIREHVCHILEG
jgi:flagellar hook protein FlgE